MKVYIVQGNSRDFGGAIKLVTEDENKALQECIKLTLLYNKEDFIRKLRNKYSDKEFYNRVCTSAWVAGFWYDCYTVQRAN